MGPPLTALRGMFRPREQVAVSLLKRIGVVVAKQAVNGEEAAEFAKEEPFDVIFMDVRAHVGPRKAAPLCSPVHESCGCCSCGTRIPIRVCLPFKTDRVSSRVRPPPTQCRCKCRFARGLR